MTDVLDYAPIAATVFAVPQFLPQIRKLRATRDTAGVSWPWATFTTVNNAAWFAYFWTALVTSASVTLLAGMLAVMLTLRGQARGRSSALVAAWAMVLSAGYVAAGRDVLGTLLAASFVLQVAPSIWTAYRETRPTGISPGTWLLILAELACWLLYGLHQGDPRLIALGATGVTASTLMLARVWYCQGRARPAPGPGQAGLGALRPQPRRGGARQGGGGLNRL
jgi:uncharacterized protein with PQ loop repeat